MLNRKADVDDLADLAEPLLDKASLGFLESFGDAELTNLVESLPGVKLGIVAARIFSSAKNYYRERYLKSFLQGLRAGDNTIEEFNKLSEKDKSRLRGLVISQLDLQSDERQAEAMGYAVDAYLSNKIDRLTLVGIISELKNINPLLFYFSEYYLHIDNNNTIHDKPTLKGPTSLLPTLFYYTTTYGRSGWDATPPSTASIPTEIGGLFFTYVYEPMCDKYKP